MENNKIKCNICSSEFTPEEIGKNHYIATSKTSTVFASIVTECLYDAFDCPICKCQNILGERKQSFYTGKNIKDKLTTVEKVENKADECRVKAKNCFGNYDNENIDCGMCDVILSCKKQTIDNINEKHDKIINEIFEDKLNEVDKNE